jgi:hypothetical protein
MATIFPGMDQDAVAQVYDAGSYIDRIDYTQPCFPPLADEDQIWANERIRERS